MAKEIVEMMEQYEVVVKGIQDDHPVPCYFIRIYYLTQALTLAGSNKSPAYDTIRKIAVDKIEKCEKLKQKYPDIKERKEDLLSLVSEQFEQLSEEDETCVEYTREHVEAYSHLCLMIKSLN